MALTDHKVDTLKHDISDKMPVFHYLQSAVRSTPFGHWELAANEASGGTQLSKLALNRSKLPNIRGENTEENISQVVGFQLVNLDQCSTSELARY